MDRADVIEAVGIVGNNIVDTIGDPKTEVWFSMHLYYISPTTSFVVTRDGVTYYHLDYVDNLCRGLKTIDMELQYFDLDEQRIVQKAIKRYVET